MCNEVIMKSIYVKQGSPNSILLRANHILNILWKYVFLKGIFNLKFRINHQVYYFHCTDSLIGLNRHNPATKLISKPIYPVWFLL